MKTNVNHPTLCRGETPGSVKCLPEKACCCFQMNLDGECMTLFRFWHLVFVDPV